MHMQHAHGTGIAIVVGMNCPTCNVELRMGDRFGVEVNYCPQCRGVWLERGALDKVVERSSSSEPEMRGHDFDDRHHHDSPYGREYRGHKRRSLFDFFD
jgi:Zn-finger nucleic acid-binding protein